ncbi:MAG TPA: selenium-binding protein SBP56-related protein, partial [Thiolinea sp.]|nr:selenium-binding protein SBP56-related protein [Thiolinea sp.]
MAKGKTRFTALISLGLECKAHKICTMIFTMEERVIMPIIKKTPLLSAVLGAALLSVALLPAQPVQADETCMSPFMAKITGQEDYVYVWTLGVEGLGDGQDKLVTIDVNPASADYGKVINSLSVGGRNEAHHSGLTDDRKYLWAGGLDTNKIFIFDVATDPAKPSL